MKSVLIGRETKPRGPRAIPVKDDRATPVRGESEGDQPPRCGGSRPSRERNDAEAKPRRSFPNARGCQEDISSKGPADERARTRRSSLPTDNRLARGGGRSFPLAHARRHGVRAGPSLEWGG